MIAFDAMHACSNNWRLWSAFRACATHNGPRNDLENGTDVRLRLMRGLFDGAHATFL